MGSVLIMNHTGQPMELIYDVSVRHSNFGSVFQGTTHPMEVSNFGHSVGNQDLPELDWSSKEWNRKLENGILRTGKLPDGRYTVCIKAREGRKLIAEECGDFEILSPDPPQLLAPEDKSSVQMVQPVFLWTPVMLPAEHQVAYKLIITEILSKQSPLRALRSNTPFLEITTPSTNYPYPLDALPLENGKSYAWWVQAVDEAGNAVAGNAGHSEVFSFNFKAPERLSMLPGGDILKNPSLANDTGSASEEETQEDESDTSGRESDASDYKTISYGAFKMTGHGQAVSNYKTVLFGDFTMTGHGEGISDYKTISYGAFKMTGHGQAASNYKTVLFGDFKMTGHGEDISDYKTISYGAFKMTGHGQVASNYKTIPYGAFKMTGHGQAASNYKTVLFGKFKMTGHFASDIESINGTIINLEELTMTGDKPVQPESISGTVIQLEELTMTGYKPVEPESISGTVINLEELTMTGLKKKSTYQEDE